MSKLIDARQKDLRLRLVHVPRRCMRCEVKSFLKAANLGVTPAPKREMHSGAYRDRWRPAKTAADFCRGPSCLDCCTS